MQIVVAESWSQLRPLLMKPWFLPDVSSVNVNYMTDGI